MTPPAGIERFGKLTAGRLTTSRRQITCSTGPSTLLPSMLLSSGRTSGRTVKRADGLTGKRENRITGHHITATPTVLETGAGNETNGE